MIRTKLGLFCAGMLTGMAALDVGAFALALSYGNSFADIVADFPLRALTIIGAIFSALAVFPWLITNEVDGYGVRWFMSLVLTGGMGIITGFINGIVNRHDLEVSTFLYGAVGLVCGLAVCVLAQRVAAGLPNAPRDA